MIEAEVISSSRERTYKVKFKEPNLIDSDDNGSRFKGYLGYPSIALLMLLKKLSFDQQIAESLKGIPWKELNEKYKNYWIVEQLIKRKIAKKIKPHIIYSILPLSTFMGSLSGKLLNIPLIIFQIFSTQLFLYKNLKEFL